MRALVPVLLAAVLLPGCFLQGEERSFPDKSAEVVLYCWDAA